ncbi:MAG: hypothetical protein IJU48_06940 [Synergistaceae bacterium]|nr:hypothetical protein [Synergistaceae bacterium]
MIPVSRIVSSLRYSLRDMQGLNVSDFELIEAINQASALLYGRLAEKFIHTALKKTLLVVDEDGQTTLPSDFVSVHRVGMGEEGYAVPESYRPDEAGTYRIAGNNFYAPEGSYSFEYYYLPQRVTSLTDRLDVPLSLSPYIEQISAAMLSKDLSTAEQLAQLCCNVQAGGEISHLENTGPVEILGGML